MSAQQQGSFPGATKKAVHVKWAGKTIALGTFPAAEADEKCARAKALTRAWRSSMRPKPTREWVMVELERLGVRVVSGRLGRKAGEEGDDGDKKSTAAAMAAQQGMPGSIERTPSLGWGTSDLDIMARRNSSLGLSMMNDAGRRGSLGSLGQVVGMEGDPTMPPHRPMVGGGAAAAYEASRHDHYSQKGEQQRRSSSLNLGTIGGGLGSIGMSVNPNQHYEMLKLHHMNLLNEIQETTLMMNLYQQQQLQQQQQQLQQQAGDMSDSQMSMVIQNQSGGGLDPMFQLQQQRASLGLGGSQLGAGAFGGGGSQQMPVMQQQQLQQPVQQSSTDQGSRAENEATTSQAQADAAPAPATEAATKEAAKTKQSDDAAAASGDSSENKREAEDNSKEEPPAKKPKIEEEEIKTEATGGDEKK